MKRGLRHVVVFLLVLCMIAGSISALAAGRQAVLNAGRVSLSAGQKAALAKSMKAFMKSGLPVNGVRRAQLLPIKRGVKAKASLRSVSLAPMPSVMGLKYIEDYTNSWSCAHPILVTTNPSDAAGSYEDWTFKFEPEGVCHIDYVEIDEDYPPYPFLIADSLGSTRLTITIGGRSASKVINVRDTVPIASLTPYELSYDEDDEPVYTRLGTRTVPSSSYMHLYIVANPSSATYGGIGGPDPLFAANYASSNDAVASVDAAIPGMLSDVYVKQPGAAVITVSATDGSRAKTSFKLNVKGRLIEEVYLEDEFAIQPGTTQWVPFYYEPYSAWNPVYTWSVANKKVATIDRYDRINALTPGNTQIGWSYKPTRLAATSDVSVTYDKEDTGTDYYFVGIANSDYDDDDSDLPACANDLTLMTELFRQSGVPDENIHSYGNKTADEMRDILWNIDPDYDIGSEDVLVFYYSGHGRGSYDQYERGALVGTDFESVTVDDVQMSLENLDCTVVVILDSCLSGQYITSKSVSPAAKIAQANAFNQAWVSAFAKSDASAAVKKPSKATGKALTDYWYPQGKFRILTACAPLEVSWTDPYGDEFGWFTYWLAKGMGMDPDREGGSIGTFGSGRMMADTDSASVGAVTLAEAYNYVKAKITAESDLYLRQTTSVWPANNPTAIVNTIG